MRTTRSRFIACCATYRSTMSIFLLILLLCIQHTTTQDNSNQERFLNDIFKGPNITNFDPNSEFSHMYQVQMEFQAVEMSESDEQLGSRLKTLVTTAFNAAVARHARLTSQRGFVRVHEDLTTQIVRRKVFGDHAFINFVTFIDNQAVLGEVITGDLGLLSSNMISAIMHYPLTRISVNAFTDSDEGGLKPWVIILIITSGILLLACGWFILFVYFNTCGASRKTVSSIEYQLEPNLPNQGMIVHAMPPWAREGHFHHALNADKATGVSPVQTTKQQPESSDAAIQTVDTTVVTRGEIDELLRIGNKENMHYRRTRVIPSESSPSSFELPEVRNLTVDPEFDVNALFTPTTVEDGTSSSDDENILDESLPTKGRPKAAGKKRHSLFEESPARSKQRTPIVWKSYSTEHESPRKSIGASKFSFKSAGHPMPSEATESGVIEIIQTSMTTSL